MSKKTQPELWKKSTGKKMGGKTKMERQSEVKGGGREKLTTVFDCEPFFF
jgi:hypothetical protein